MFVFLFLYYSEIFKKFLSFQIFIYLRLRGEKFSKINFARAIIFSQRRNLKFSFFKTEQFVFFLLLYSDIYISYTLPTPRAASISDMKMNITLIHTIYQRACVTYVDESFKPYALTEQLKANVKVTHSVKLDCSLTAFRTFNKELHGAKYVPLKSLFQFTLLPEGSF